MSRRHTLPILCFALLAALACSRDVQDEGSAVKDVLASDLPGSDAAAPQMDAGDVPTPPEDAQEVQDGSGGGFDWTGWEVIPGVPCEEQCGTGTVIGKVCAPNSHTYVNNAKVWIDAVGCDGQPVHIETQSTLNGGYTLEGVPCGSWKVNYEKGAFSHWFQIELDAGEVRDVSELGVKMCFGASAARLCVITGDWDTIEQTLTDLGFEFELFELYDGWCDSFEGGCEWWGAPAHRLLEDLTKMQDHCDVLFVDCGEAHCELLNGTPQVAGNVRGFVEQGGSLYASDFAYCYGEAAWPEAIDFYGADEQCSMGDSGGPIQMPGNTTVEAIINDQDLAGILGKSNFNAHFGLGPLVSVHAAGPGTTSHVVGFVDTFGEVQPFVLSFQPTPAGGHVVYTNFHNDEQTNEDMATILDYLVFQL